MGDQPEICQLLLGAGADTAAQDEEQLTPLHFAARDGLGEVLVSPVTNTLHSVLLRSRWCW